MSGSEKSHLVSLTEVDGSFFSKSSIRLCRRRHRRCLPFCSNSTPSSRGIDRPVKRRILSRTRSKRFARLPIRSVEGADSSGTNADLRRSIDRSGSALR